MLTFDMIKPIGTLLKKLDIKELMSEIRKIDMEKDSAKEELGYLIILTLAEHLEDISEPLTELCAVFKGVSADEIKKENPFEVIKEIFTTAGFTDFFSFALKRDMKE